MNRIFKGHSLIYSALYKRGRVCLLMALFIIIAQGSQAQCDIITDLKKDKLTELSLYFYPSTLRMANLDKNEEFNRLIQDIKKLVFYRMNGKFEMIDLYNIYQELQSNDFEEYVVVDGPKQKFYLLGREKPTETIGLALIEGQYYIFDIAGSLEVKEIPKLYKYISQNDSTFKNKFSQLLDLAAVGQNMAENNHR
ncbi:MAG: hypothetical protein ABJF11_13000 [Reichenbachiella sp.]|uniref:hypothetical protein n=1 Tax=Reichenbachiella sp. TaxID=2184521 RepID=UPI003264D6FC